MRAQCLQRSFRGCHSILRRGLAREPAHMAPPLFCRCTLRAQRLLPCVWLPAVRPTLRQLRRSQAGRQRAARSGVRIVWGGGVRAVFGLRRLSVMIRLARIGRLLRLFRVGAFNLRAPETTLRAMGLCPAADGRCHASHRLLLAQAGGCSAAALLPSPSENSARRLSRSSLRAHTSLRSAHLTMIQLE